jgi:predicted DNA-binding transcriptional regulator YafY
VQLLNERVDKHPAFDEDALFQNSARVWSGPGVEVIVRLSPSAKRFAHEYPLHAGQSLIDEADGSVLVRATVAGTVEAMRWVLSWGKEAEAVAPAELRDAVCAEFAQGLRNYDAAAARPSRQGFRRPGRSSRLTRS